MKKIISFSLVALMCAGAFAQDVNTKEQPVQKKSSDKNVKSATLDGRSFKITFAERKSDVKPVPQTGVTDPAPDTKMMDQPVSDYSMFDANSKVMITFS